MWSILWPVYVPLTILHGSVAIPEDERPPRGLTEVLTAGMQHPQYATKIPFWLHPDATFDCKQSGYFGDPRICKQFYQCVAVLPGHFVRYVFKCNENRVYSIEQTSCVKPEENNRQECMDQSTQRRVPSPPVNTLGVAENIAPSLSSSSSSEKSSSSDENNKSPMEEDVDIDLDLPKASLTNPMHGRNSALVHPYPTSLDYLEENTVDTAEKSERGTTARNIEDERVTVVVDGTSTFPDTIDPDIRDLSFTTVPPLPFYPPNEFKSEPDTDSDSGSRTEPDTDSDTGYDDDDSTDSCDDDTTFREGEDTESLTTSTTTITPTYVVPVMNNNYGNDVACAEEGFFSDNGNCTIFYRCVPFGYSFVKHRFFCPSGTIWDNKQQTCNFPANVERAYACKYETYSVTTKDVVRLPSIAVKNDGHAADSLTGDLLFFACPTGFRQHPKYCNAFYQCTVNDRLEVNFVPFACPSGTIFDEEQIQCIKNDTALTNCAVYQLGEWPDSIRVIKLRGLGKFCPEEGQFPYGEICPTNYFKCVYNEQGELSGYLLDCPHGQLFSPAANGCVSIATFPFCARRYMTSKLNSRLPAQ